MEEKNRRTFLKVAGASLLAGVGTGGAAALARSGAKESGSQWAMVIDIKRCLQEQGCTKCIEACHLGHNVPDLSHPRFGLPPEEVPKREIKWIWKERYEHAFPEQQQDYTEELLARQQVLVLCNHCKNPSCVRVCPTQATWKRASDGIVMMDMHRCIGCRYCIVGCPYGARSFNWFEPWPRPYAPDGTPPNLDYPTRMRGVVEKCTFCADLLARSRRTGEAFVPACVEACQRTGANAMVFGDVHDRDSDVRKILRRVHAIRRKPGLGTDPQVYYIV